jgi:hypothetical protein
MITNIGLFSRVDAHMDLQGAPLDKTLLAIVAGVRPLIRVDTPVSAEVCFARKGLEGTQYERMEIDGQMIRYYLSTMLP